MVLQYCQGESTPTKTKILKLRNTEKMHSRMWGRKKKGGERETPNNWEPRKRWTVSDYFQ